MRKILAVILALTAPLCLFASCGSADKAPVKVNCHNCGKEITVPGDYLVGEPEDWIIYCKECEEKLGLDELVPSASYIK